MPRNIQDRGRKGGRKEGRKEGRKVLPFPPFLPSFTALICISWIVFLLV
jgi:hypothetical protein